MSFLDKIKSREEYLKKPIFEIKYIAQHVNSLINYHKSSWKTVNDIFLSPNRLPITKVEWQDTEAWQYFDLYLQLIRSDSIHEILNLFYMAFDPILLMEHAGKISVLINVVSLYELNSSYWYNIIFNTKFLRLNPINDIASKYQEYFAFYFNYFIIQQVPIDTSNITPIPINCTPDAILPLIQDRKDLLLWYIQTYAIPHGDKKLIERICALCDINKHELYNLLINSSLQTIRDYAIINLAEDPTIKKIQQLEERAKELELQLELNRAIQSNSNDESVVQPPPPAYEAQNST